MHVGAGVTRSERRRCVDHAGVAAAHQIAGRIGVAFGEAPPGHGTSRVPIVCAFVRLLFQRLPRHQRLAQDGSGCECDIDLRNLVIDQGADL